MNRMSSTYHPCAVFQPTVKLVNLTDDAEQLMVSMAKVSSSNNISNVNLLKYLIKHKHWSPFEMVTMTVMITTTREISRQIIRHRSFSFQEFSQRYQKIGQIQHEPCIRECRVQDYKNRQNSFLSEDVELNEEWEKIQKEVWDKCIEAYNECLELKIAKEQARCLLPEGMTKTQMYMTGSLRSWMHYADLRGGNGTQREHLLIAEQIKKIFRDKLPTCANAMGF